MRTAYVSIKLYNTNCALFWRNKVWKPAKSNGKLNLCNWSKRTCWHHQMETFLRYRPFVRRIHRSPVNSPHKGQWRRALMFSLICVWINGWVNNSEAGDLRRYRAHYDVTVMIYFEGVSLLCSYWLNINNMYFRPVRFYTGPFFWHGLTLIQARISNYIHCEMGDEITSYSEHFSGATINTYL